MQNYVKSLPATGGMGIAAGGLWRVFFATLFIGTLIALLVRYAWRRDKSLGE